MEALPKLILPFLLLSCFLATTTTTPFAFAYPTPSSLLLPNLGDFFALISPLRASPSSPNKKTPEEPQKSPPTHLFASSSTLHNETKEAILCPTSCFRPKPVCGVDGVTYWCGAADAECAGVQVESVGYCNIGSQGTGGKGVLAVQSFLLIHMIWLVLAAFLVLLGIP